MSLVKSKYIVECGPSTDQKILKIYLDPFRRKVGILVSGGLDSALLYYLLVKLNVEQEFTHKITPYTILRKDGSCEFAQSIIDYVCGSCNERQWGFDQLGQTDPGTI